MKHNPQFTEELNLLRAYLRPKDRPAAAEDLRAVLLSALRLLAAAGDGEIVAVKHAVEPIGTGCSSTAFHLCASFRDVPRHARLEDARATPIIILHAEEV